MKNIILILIFIFASTLLSAQSNQKEEITLKLSLEQAIEIANKQSIYSFKQKNMYLAGYWEYRSYKAEKLPGLSLQSNLINYNKSISQRFIDGEDQLTPTNIINSSASLNLTQNITLTGATIYAQSKLNRLSNLDSDNLFYSSVPITIGISQPLNGFNKFKWLSKIEPLKFEQVKKNYLQSIQELSKITTDMFFNLVTAEINLSIAQTNLSNADTLYNIGKGRFEIGTVTQDELLDLELSSLNAKMELQRAKIKLEQGRAVLNSFLSIDDNIKIACILPDKIPSLKVKVDDAMKLAYENNPEISNYEERLLQSDLNVATAKSAHGVNISIDANLGYNNSSDNFNGAYKSPFKNEKGVNLSLGIPILDWGLKKGKVQMARSNKKVTEAEIRQAKIDFEQNLFIQVMEFNMQQDLVEISSKANTIAQKGYEVTKQRFLIDKVDVIRLNEARKSLDAAKRNYIQSIQNYWISHFNIKKLTLYDFEKNKTLIEDLDSLLQQ